MISGVVSFLTSRAGLVAIALIAGFLYGHRVASQGEEARGLRDENAALRIDLVAATNAARIAEAEAAGLRDLQRDLKEAVDAYAADLASRPEDSACRLGDSDIERLRKLR